MVSYGDARKMIEDVQKLIGYVQDFRHAEKEKADLQREMTHLCLILQEIEEQGTQSEIIGILDQMGPCIQQLQKTLKGNSERMERPLYRWMATHLSKLRWSKQKRDIEKDLEKIHRFTQQLELVTTSDIRFIQSDEARQRDIQKIVDFWTPPISKELCKHPARVEFIAEGTGMSFQRQAQYRDWKESNSGLLWVKGMQGTGKTGLAVILDNTLKEEAGNPPAFHVACIFCDHQTDGIDRVSHMDIVMSLWIQLASRLPDPKFDPEFVKDSLPKSYPGHLSLHKRIDFQKEMFKYTTSRLGSVVLILDGLDELPQHLQIDVVESLKEIQESSTRCRLLITSRPYEKINRLSKDDSQLSLEARDIDLDKYIRERITRAKWKHIQGSGLNDLIDTLIPKCKSLFLLCKLFMDEVLRATSQGECDRIIKTLPEEVGVAYDRGLDRLAQEFTQKRNAILPCMAIRALFWVAFVKSPIKSDELKQALAIDDTETNYDPGNQMWKDTDFDDLTGHLLIIDPRDGKLRVAHRSLTEHLTNPATFEKWFPTIRAHIPTTLLRCLSPGCLDIATTALSKDEFMDLYPLCSYALKNWGRDLAEILEPGTPLWDRTEAFLKAPSDGWNDFIKDQAARALEFGSKFATPSIRERMFTPGTISGLHWAVVFDLPMLVPILTSHENEHPILDPIPMTPLGLAAFYDREDVAKELLRSGAQVNVDQTAGHPVRQPLYDAIYYGNKRITSLLLQNGADMTLRHHDNDESPLDLTYELESGRITHMLADHISTLDKTTAQGLQLLVRGGLAKQLEKAIANGLDVNHPCENGKMALDYARELRHAEIVDILLNAQAVSKLTWPAVDTDSCPYPVNFISPPSQAPLISREASWEESRCFRVHRRDSPGFSKLLIEIPVHGVELPIRSIVFETVSKDQGWGGYSDRYSDTYLGSGSKLEVCVKHQHGTSRRFMLQHNVFASTEFRLHTNIWNLKDLETSSPAKADLLRSIQNASTLQVYAIAYNVLGQENHISFIRVSMFSSEVVSQH